MGTTKEGADHNYRGKATQALCTSTCQSLRHQRAAPTDKRSALSTIQLTALLTALSNIVYQAFLLCLPDSESGV